MGIPWRKMQSNQTSVDKRDVETIHVPVEVERGTGPNWLAAHLSSRRGLAAGRIPAMLGAWRKESPRRARREPTSSGIWMTCYEPGNLYLRTVGSVLDAADLLDVPHEVKLILSQPKNEIMVHCPVRMDDGRWELFKG
jgi:hypothetical protein